jgi:hypothetical protein
VAWGVYRRGKSRTSATTLGLLGSAALALLEAHPETALERKPGHGSSKLDEGPTHPLVTLKEARRSSPPATASGFFASAARRLRTARRDRLPLLLYTAITFSRDRPSNPLELLIAD